MRFRRKSRSGASDASHQLGFKPSLRRLVAPRSRSSRRLIYVLIVAAVAMSGRSPVDRTLEDSLEPAQAFLPAPLTSWFGDQTAPSFSPDATQIAFAWKEEAAGNFDIYVMTIGSSQPLRLTTGASDNYSPAWSPDGKWIAFCARNVASPPPLMSMPALGGSARVLRKPMTRRNPGAAASRVAGRTLDRARSVRTEQSATEGISAVSVTGGQIERLTFPGKGEFDMYPTYAPDGKTLAFSRRERELARSGCCRSMRAEAGPGAATRTPLRGFESVHQRRSGLAAGRQESALRLQLWLD